jgi:hypothetical protein
LIQEHLSNTGPLIAPTLNIPDFSQTIAMRPPSPAPAAVAGGTLEKKFDELLAIAEGNAARRDGGQTNYFELGSETEAARIAAELRRLSRMRTGRIL